jgi:hypothetical protein
VFLIPPRCKINFGSTVFNGKIQNFSHEYFDTAQYKFHEFARSFETFRENSREFVAKKPCLTASSRPKRESRKSFTHAFRLPGKSLASCRKKNEMAAWSL